MTGCKSPSHEAYRQATEGARIQSYMIEQHLHAATQRSLDEVTDWDAVFSEARDRMNYAQDELKRSQHALNAHFGRGCSLVEEGLAAVR